MRLVEPNFRPRANLFRTLLLSWLAFGTVSGVAVASGPRTVKGLKNPESVVVGPGGRVYVSLMGDPGKPGDGSIVIVDALGKITPFSTGLDDPRGLSFVGNFLYVADARRVRKVDVRGKHEIYVDSGAFPQPPGFLEDISSDGLGNLYVSDGGSRGGSRGAVYRIDSRKRVIQVLDGDLSSPRIAYPKGVIADPPDHLIVADFVLGDLYRCDLNTRNAQRISGGFGGVDGLARDAEGALYLGDARTGRIYQITTDLEPPSLLTDQIRSPAGICLTPDGRTLLVTDTKAGTLTWLPTR